MAIKFLDVPNKDRPRRTLFAGVLRGLASGVERLQIKEFELTVQDLSIGTLEPASGAAGRAQAEKLFPRQNVGFVFGLGDRGGPTMLINVASDNANPLDV